GRHAPREREVRVAVPDPRLDGLGAPESCVVVVEARAEDPPDVVRRERRERERHVHVVALPGHLEDRGILDLDRELGAARESLLRLHQRASCRGAAAPTPPVVIGRAWRRYQVPPAIAASTSTAWSNR